jgi:hypothetical protein
MVRMEVTMALQLGATREAFIAAGVPTDKANAAAEELAGYDNRLAAMDTRLTLLTWMVGFNLVLTAGVLWRLLAH